jgi:hypothetical protein
MTRSGEAHNAGTTEYGCSVKPDSEAPLTLQSLGISGLWSSE